MTDRDLKKLSRVELLELLIAQTKETERLRVQLEEANAKLESRTIEVKEAGSIAEAALRLNGVFTAAQEAAAQYLENVKQRYDLQEEECRKMKEECLAECAAIRAQTEEKCQREMKAADTYWEVITQRLQGFFDDHGGLDDMLVEIENEYEA